MKRLAGTKPSIALWAVLILGARSAPVLAESPSVTIHAQQARLHFLAGRRAFERDDFANALEEFRMGYAIDPRPAFLLDMGHAALHLGNVLEARELYTRFLRTNPPKPERDVASRFVAQIDHELASAREAHPSANEPPAGALNPADAEVRSADPLRVTSLPTAPVAPRAVAGPPIPIDNGASSAVPGHKARVSEPERPFPNRGRMVDLDAKAPPVDDLRTGAAVARPTLSATQEKLPPTSEASAVDPARGHRRWWLWGAAGVVAVGVLTAVIAGNSGASPAHADGSWGRITFPP